MLGIWIFLALLLLVASAFFVVAKFSFARLRKEYIERMAEEDEEEQEKWQYVANLYDDPNRFLGTAQLGTILTTMLFGYVVYRILLITFRYTKTDVWSAGLIIVVSFLLAAFVHWVWAELIPKSLGLNFAPKWLRRTAGITMAFSKVAAPFLWLGEKIADFFLSGSDIKVTSEVDLSHSEEEIRLLISTSHMEGQLDDREGELIKNAFDFVDRLAREVMVPRQDMSVLYYEDDLETMRVSIRDSRHTRYPLCDGDKDHIIGLVHVKNFMEIYISGGRDIKEIVTDILVIPEVMPIADLLQLMKARRIYLAVVVDEYGGTVGLVALEDIIEELVGDIQDEHEEEASPLIEELPNGGYEFDGTVILEDVEECLDMDFAEVDADTIGGYVFALLERIPRIGDHVIIGDWDFRVDKLSGFRIIRLTATPLPISQKEDTE